MMASAVAMLYEFNYYNGDHLLEKMNIPVVELLKVRYDLLHYCLCRSGHLFAGKISVVECKNPNMSLQNSAPEVILISLSSLLMTCGMVRVRSNFHEYSKALKGYALSPSAKAQLF